MALGRGRVAPLDSNIYAETWKQRKKAGKETDHENSPSPSLENNTSATGAIVQQVCGEYSHENLDNRVVTLVDGLDETTADGKFSSDVEDGSYSLHQYLLQLDEEEIVDFNYLDELISSRESLDIYNNDGDLAIHIMARKGLLDAMKHIHCEKIDYEAVNRSGYRPLHLASCGDHSDVVEYLIAVANVDMDSRTCGDNLTPVHCAARSNALNSLKTLIDVGASYDLVDYRGRTPLHLAVEYDRSFAVQLLMGLPQPASCVVRDNFGQLALATMIENMPKLAEVALSLPEIRELDASKGQQSFHIAQLEPCTISNNRSPSVFSAAIESHNHSILQQAVIQKILEVKWKLFRPYFALHYFLYILFMIVWTVILVYPSTPEMHLYVFPRDVWRVIVWVLALGLLLMQVLEEVWEAVQSKRISAANNRWRQEGLEQDQLFLSDPSVCHLKDYNDGQLSSSAKKRFLTYFFNFWNIIDIASYLLLLITFLLHLVDIGVHSLNDQVAVWQGRISCLAIILIWMRSLKYARALTSLGPFIVIIGYAMKDVLRYAFVFATFIIPSSVCFWIVFGGVVDDTAFTSFPRVIFMLYRTSLVDDYPFQAMADENETLTFILVGVYLWVTAVMGLNLFIALLSYTFQNVYENAKTNAQLQRATVVLDYEILLFGPLKRLYWKYIRDHCSPLVCEYDDDEHLKDDGGESNSIQAVEEMKATLIQQMQLIRELQEDIRKMTQDINSPTSDRDCKGLHTTGNDASIPDGPLPRVLPPRNGPSERGKTQFVVVKPQMPVNADSSRMATRPATTAVSSRMATRPATTAVSSRMATRPHSWSVEKRVINNEMRSSSTFLN